MSASNGNKHGLKLSPVGSQGVFYLLTTSDLKGKRVKDASKVMRSLKAGCMKMEDSFKGNFHEGVLEVDTDRLWFLDKLLTERVDGRGSIDGKAIVGLYAEGVDELQDAVDDALVFLKVAEKAAEKEKEEAVKQV
jgi:hypothetical protein